MPRFVEGCDRRQIALLPDYVTEDNAVRVVDAFIDELDLAALGFAGRGVGSNRPSLVPPGHAVKIYLYGYLNQVQSSRRLERQSLSSALLRW